MEEIPEKDLIAQQNKLIQMQPPSSIDAMIGIALNKDADIDKLTKLFELKKQYDAEEAKKAFHASLAAFQAKLKPIVKKRKAHNSVYADIDDIAQSIRPILEECGLSYRFEQQNADNVMTVTCIVSHAQGHSEALSMSAPYDTSGGKNAIQSIASSVTYLRRYTMTGVFGITTGLEDNDGGKPEITVEDLLKYNELVREEIHTVAAVKEGIASGDLSTAKEAWCELDENIQRGLWRAPTKGGIFTTDERTMIKSNEWSKA